MRGRGLGPSASLLAVCSGGGAPARLLAERLSGDAVEVAETNVF